MKAKRFFSVFFIMCMLPFSAQADVWQDPETKVNYEYTVGESEASVKGGDFTKAGSVDVDGDITLLSHFSVDGNEYMVTTIGNYAFYKCNSLTSIFIPEGITTIGKYAFSGCMKLKSLSLPESLTSILDGAFRNCSDLSVVSIPDAVEFLGSYVFNGCSELNSVKIPQNIVNIGNEAFTDTPWYNALYEAAPDGLFYYDNILFGFKGAAPVGAIEIKKGTRVIAGDAFNYNCPDITSVILPEGLVGIGYSAFRWCNNMETINLPSSLRYIDEFTFRDCSALTSITIPEGITSIKKCSFESCSRLLSLSLPTSLTEIGEYAFRSTGLQSVDIPYGVETIGGNAFYECFNLTDVTIPSTVTSIGHGAFYCCNILNTVKSFISNPFEIGVVFYSHWDMKNKIIMLHVPYGTKDLYEATPTWSDQFISIVEMEKGTANVENKTASIGARIEAYYTLGGQRIDTGMKGLNIVRQANGGLKKVLIK